MKYSHCIRYLFSLCSLCCAPLISQASSLVVEVSNPINMQRQQLVELDAQIIRQKLGLAANQSFVVRNSTRQQVDYQLTYDGKVLVDFAVKPCGKTEFTISPGVPEPMQCWVEGKMYPLRKDDIGWENDRGAYRVYGPSLQRTGERSFGIDVWTKNSKELNMSKRYYNDYEGNVTGWANAVKGHKNDSIDLHTSFHLDHGEGLDCYAVGPSMGCGAPALMIGDSLVLPYCYQKYRILDNGPLRFTVELTFRPARIGEDSTVVEHRIISLDKGSNFNRMTVWYTGLNHPHNLAAGIVIHTADTHSVVIGNNYVQYADPTDQPEKYGFQLYVAALFPNGAATRYLPFKHPHDGIAGHALGVVNSLKNSQHYTYYFGSAWSCYDVRTQSEWQLRIDEQLQMLGNPLYVYEKGTQEVLSILK